MCLTWHSSYFFQGNAFITVCHSLIYLWFTLHSEMWMLSEYSWTLGNIKSTLCFKKRHIWYLWYVKKVGKVRMVILAPCHATENKASSNSQLFPFSGHSSVCTEVSPILLRLLFQCLNVSLQFISNLFWLLLYQS